MPSNGKPGPVDEFTGSYSRRRLLAALGLGTAGGLAGCGGDGGDDGGGGTTTGGPTTTGSGQTSSPGTSTADPTTGPGGSTTTESTQTDKEPPDDTVLDRVFRVHVDPPGPEVAQYNTFNGNVVWKPGAAMCRFDLLRQTAVDRSWQPELLKDWSYTSGIFTGELYHDHYWAETNLEDDSPRNITADDWLGLYEIKNFFRPHAWPFISKTEKLGKYRFRIYFDDTYRGDYVMRKSIHKESLDNLGFYRPYLERFREATSEEKVTEIQVELQNRKIYNPNVFINVPFKVTGSTSTAWQFELRDDEDPMPHYTDQINYRYFEAVVSAEPARSRQAYINGKLPMAGSSNGAAGGISVVDADVPFETETIQMPIANGPGAYGFNFARSPTDNVHFRRAFAYMLDASTHKTRFMDVDRNITGMLSEERENQFISQEILEATSKYGFDEVRREDATAEMKAGGFERDSEGNWVYKEGDRAGEPMAFKIKCYPWQMRQANNATAFKNNMADWGINLEVTTAPLSTLWGQFGDGEFEIALGYWGGATPTAAYTNAFYPSAKAAFTVHGFPGEWTGPPIGKRATPPGEATDETRTYEVAELLQNLQLTRDETLYDEYVDTLAWIYNQCLPHVPIGYEPRIFSLKTEGWNWPLPVSDHPFAWDGPPEQRIWNRGVLEAV